MSLSQFMESTIVLYAEPLDIRQRRIDLAKHALESLQALQRRAPLVQKLLAATELEKSSHRLGPILAKYGRRDLERKADPADLAAARAIVERAIAKDDVTAERE